MHEYADFILDGSYLIINMRNTMTLKCAFLLLLLLWFGMAGVTYLSSNSIDSHNKTSSS